MQALSHRTAGTSAMGSRPRLPVAAKASALWPPAPSSPMAKPGLETIDAGSNAWAVIRVPNNGSQQRASPQFVEVGHAICVQAKALSHEVGERIKFSQVMAYKGKDKQLRRFNNKRGYLPVHVEGVVADEFQAPTPANDPNGLKLHRVLITKIEEAYNGAEHGEGGSK